MLKIAALLIAIVTVVGFMCWLVSQPDTCKERRAFDVGNSTLGAKGTYCAKW